LDQGAGAAPRKPWRSPAIIVAQAHRRTAKSDLAPTESHAPNSFSFSS
jgi:hypothetical protein